MCARKNSWSGGSIAGSGFSTVRANSNFAIDENKREENSDTLLQLKVLYLLILHYIREDFIIFVYMIFKNNSDRAC